MMVVGGLSWQNCLVHVAAVSAVAAIAVPTLASLLAIEHNMCDG